MDGSAECDIHEPNEWILNEEQPNKDEKLFKIRSSFAKIDPYISCAHSFEEETPPEKDLFRYDRGGIDLYIVSVSRDKAIKIAAERIRQIKAEEHFRYPLLRRCAVEYEGRNIPSGYPTYHFFTGEIVLEHHQKLTTDECPEGLLHTIKVRRMDE